MPCTRHSPIFDVFLPFNLCRHQSINFDDSLRPVIIFFMLILLLNALLIFKQSDSTIIGSDNICLTRECVQTAGEVFRNMDESVDPCADFYQFACGNYIKHSLISNDKTFANTFTVINDILQEQIKMALEEPAENEPKPFATVKKYYTACKNKCKSNPSKSKPVFIISSVTFSVNRKIWFEYS